MPLCVYDNGKRTFMEFDPKRVDFEGIPGLMALNETITGTKYTQTKLATKRDKNGEFIGNPMIVVDGIFDRFNIFANKGKSRAIVIKRLNQK